MTMYVADTLLDKFGNPIGGGGAPDLTEIKDLIYGMTPPLAVQYISGDDYDKTLWAVPDINGVCEFSNNTKLYNYLLADHNLGTTITDPDSGTMYKRLGKSGRIYISPGELMGNWEAQEEFNTKGVAWYWDLSEANKIIFPRTKHFLNNSYDPEIGNYSHDQIVDIVGTMSMTPHTGGSKSGAFIDSIYRTDAYAGMGAWNGSRMSTLDFKASNSAGVNVGEWVQPRATALRMAFYIGFLNHSNYKNL